MKTIKEIMSQFEITKEQMLQISQDFKKAIEVSLDGKPSPLLMIPSYIGKPSGKESGEYIAVDMGGTNIRVGKFQIGDCKIVKGPESKASLKNEENGYDFTSSDTTGFELYDFIASKMDKLVSPDEELYLGHTFSFATEQTGINDAVLLGWSKEISVQGVEGKNPNHLLAEAIDRRNIKVKPCAIINDTVGTLLVAACTDMNANIASIVGTGHNTCYVEPKHPLTGKPMIINMEAANFDWGLPFTIYDNRLDQNSKKPGKGRLEKMVSGAYLGEVVRLILVDLKQRGLIFGDSHMDESKLVKKDSIDTKMIAEFISNKSSIEQVFSCNEEDVKIVLDFASLIVKRAAQLVASTYLGTLMHLDPELMKEQTIGIDGSIYEKMPGFHDAIKQALKEMTGAKADKIQLKLVKDGSGAGAAVAASMIRI